MSPRMSTGSMVLSGWTTPLRGWACTVVGTLAASRTPVSRANSVSWPPEKSIQYR